MGGEAFDLICGALGKHSRLVNLHVGVNNVGVRGAAALSGTEPSLDPDFVKRAWLRGDSVLVKAPRCESMSARVPTTVHIALSLSLSLSLSHTHTL